MDDRFVLERGALRVEVSSNPLRVDIRREDRRLIRSMRPWCCEGEVRDRFLQVTEGVIADESHGQRELALEARSVRHEKTVLELRLTLDGGRRATLTVRLGGGRTVDVEFDADDDPLRLCLEWNRRDGEHFAGLGARHHHKVDHGDRAIQLGADRR